MIGEISEDGLPAACRDIDQLEQHEIFEPNCTIRKLPHSSCFGHATLNSDRYMLRNFKSRERSAWSGTPTARSQRIMNVISMESCYLRPRA